MLFVSPKSQVQNPKKIPRVKSQENSNLKISRISQGQNPILLSLKVWIFFEVWILDFVFSPILVLFHQKLDNRHSLISQ